MSGRKIAACLVSVLGLSCLGEAETATNVCVRVRFDEVVGPVKPMHGVGQPPMVGAPVNFKMMPYLKEAGVPFSRLHDVGGPYGGGVYVDIPNLFRDFDADETDPANYDFAFTDRLLLALEKNGVEPYFRLGVTIENYPFVRRYRIDPPKDPAKWARICEHVVRHYTEGWAEGYRMKIRYWEIWNEPDSKPDPERSMMWHGTFDYYCRLYGVVSKHLKKCFPHLKIGGYAACGFYHLTGMSVRTDDDRTRFPHYMKCFDDFLAYVRAQDCPLDFFSYHCYDSVSNAVVQNAFVRKRLDEAGFIRTEMSLNEWLPPSRVGTQEQAAQIAAMMLACQNGPVDTAMVYDARCGVGSYSPLFDPSTCLPRPAYWTLKAFNELYRRKSTVACTTSVDGVYAVAAACCGDGAVMISNVSGRSLNLSLDLGGGIVSGCRIIDAKCMYQDMSVPEQLESNAVLLVFVTCRSN